MDFVLVLSSYPYARPSAIPVRFYDGIKVHHTSITLVEALLSPGTCPLPLFLPLYPSVGVSYIQWDQGALYKIAIP